MKKKQIIIVVILIAVLPTLLITYFAHYKSKQILSEYLEINNSLDSLYKTNKIKSTTEFLPENRLKVEQLKKETKALIDFIGEMKEAITRDSIDKTAKKYLFEKNNASILRRKLINHNLYIANSFPEENKEIELIPTENFKIRNDSISWEKKYFENLPSVVIIIQLSQFQTALKRVEENILKKLN